MVKRKGFFHLAEEPWAGDPQREVGLSPHFVLVERLQGNDPFLLGYPGGRGNT
jgi:hypothetical protein